MKRLVSLIALVVVSLTPIVALAQAEVTQTAERERQQLLDRLDRLREETAQAQTRAEELGETIVDLAADEAKLRDEEREVAGRVAELETRIAADEEALEALSDEQARIRQDLAARREELAAVLMALQRLGSRAPPGLAGENGRVTDALRGAILLNAVIPSLHDEAATLAETLAQASRMEADERRRWDALTEDLATLETERSRLSGLASELQRRRALSTYERDRAAADLARLAQEEGSVAALLDRVTESEASSAPADGAFTARRGTLDPPVAGRVVSQFGEATEAAGVAEGLTIAALAQSTVFAPMNASVLFSSPFRGYGHILILDAGDGYHMVLAGMESASVVPGDRVETGAPLGRMGRTAQRSTLASTGLAASALIGSRPALYVELRKDGVAIDSHGWWTEPSAGSKGTGG